MVASNTKLPYWLSSKSLGISNAMPPIDPFTAVASTCAKLVLGAAWFFQLAVASVPLQLARNQQNSPGPIAPPRALALPAATAPFVNFRSVRVADNREVSGTSARNRPSVTLRSNPHCDGMHHAGEAREAL